MLNTDKIIIPPILCNTYALFLLFKAYNVHIRQRRDWWCVTHSEESNPTHFSSLAELGHI